MVLFVVAKRKSSTEDAINMIKSMLWKLTGVIVPYMATGIPRTIHILKMLLPIMLPSSKSCSFFLDETMVVINSGKEVPKAMIVREITLSLIPIVVAIEVAFLTTNSLPIIMPTNPIATNRSDFPRG